MRRVMGMIAGLLLIAAAAAEQSIVGTWYEEADYGGSHVISILTIRADGTYSAVYRRCLQQTAVDSSGSGRWTYANRRLRMTERDGTADEYVTESNDGRVWIYRGASGPGFQKFGAVRFRDTRVGPDSQLPTCDTSV